MHIPVLLHETIEFLNPKNNEVIVDATINGGGHTGEILKKGDFNGQVIGIDQDENLISSLKEKFNEYIKEGRLKLVCGNFRDIKGHLNSIKQEKINGAIFDLGMSSWQLDYSGRGFSFMRDEPLIMSFKKEAGEQDLTAEEIVNSFRGEELYKILKEYGEERFVNRIVKNILEARKIKKIKTTFELEEIIYRSVPKAAKNKSRIHPATKTFQALRIAVNDEMNALKEGLKEAFEALEPEGRIAVISFHSLEDRIVKNYFRDLKTNKQAELLTKKPIIASFEEIKQNPRSRSAKLRGIIKV